MNPDRKLEVKGATCASCGTTFASEVLDLLPLVGGGTIGRSDAGVELVTGSHDIRQCSSCGEHVSRQRMFIFEVTDPVVTHILTRLRSERAVLDELNAEYVRARNVRRSRWDKLEELAVALKANPSREACDAYFSLVESKGCFEREEQIEASRRKCRDGMEELQGQLLELLGVRRTRADYDQS
jgi:hypothetical protein